MDWEEGIKDIYQLPDSDLKTGARYNRTMSFHDAGERSTVLYRQLPRRQPPPPQEEE